MANCKHKWVFRDSDEYWAWDGRNSKRYYHVDYYYCEKCLEENKIEKHCSNVSGDYYNLPEWARTITKQAAGYSYN